MAEQSFIDKDLLIAELLASINQHKFAPDVAHIEIHGNEVLNRNLVDGLIVESQSLEDGVSVRIRVKQGVTIKNPVHFCFGLIPENGVQRIIINTLIEEDAHAQFIANCTFPNAINIQHLMNAEIELEKVASLSYFERHVHGPNGGVRIVPVTKVRLGEGARFSTEFELIKGAAGIIELDYAAEVGKDATVDMKTRIFGRLEDSIHIRESANLLGESSTGVLTSHIAIKDKASAIIENEIVANAPYARGHVDCKEIVQNEARARAIPVVQVNNHLAHVTHEAAIGSVDSKQLETLLSRGLTEDQATDLIIEGLLS
ncbi:MAG: cysteine desulfurase activator complex subunit SufB [Spirochaetes bacterium ADurb.Bin110]|nr:MAG: cysteine desulfurase activator complex subunit SufB [Spirochaetes bacterium ADurb.Bin110]